MNILLANPAYRIDLGNDLERYFFCAGSRCPWSLVKKKTDLPRYAMFPFFMAHSAALLEKNGFKVTVIDGVPLNMSDSEFITIATQSCPDIILFEPATTSFHWTIEFSKVLKEKTGAHIALAGPHVSIYSVETIETYPHIDYVIRGEYEFAFLSLVQSIESKSEFLNISGLFYRTPSGAIIKNEKVTPVDVNMLPIPARHLFPTNANNNMGYYHDGFCQNRPAIQMHSSRGCPFKCSFCLLVQVMFNSDSYRMFSPQRVVDEMELVINKFGAKEVYFDDDTFTANKNHVIDICKEIIKRNLSIPWSAMGDAMNTDEEMLHHMKLSGCIGIKFGLESSDINILKNIKKPLQVNKLSNLINICNKLKIKTHVSVSFGHLGETKATINETLRYVCRLNADSIQFSLATPYPGTRFYNDVIQQNRLRTKDFSEYDPTHNPIVNFSDFSSSYLKHIEQISHGYWLRRKLLDPKWIYRQIYFLMYLLKKQGMTGLVKRIKRASDILFSKKFK